MADLNIMAKPSPVLKRQTSSLQMPPPPIPSSPSLNILPSNLSTVHNLTPTLSIASPHLASTAAMASPASADNTNTRSGPGPLRHPRPLTASDLYVQVEKEQEAVVNRLSRELSLLRAAQNASVVSNASSTSTGTNPAAQIAEASHNFNKAGTGFSHPLSRHNRTLSNTSNRSFTTSATNAGSSVVLVGGITSPAPVRPGQQIYGVIGNNSGAPLSRQNSSTSRHSRATSPSPQHGGGSQTQTRSNSFTHPHLSEYIQRGPIKPSTSIASDLLHHQFSPGLLPATQRYEEMAHYRAELEFVKCENESLKRRIRKLERQVRERRASDASRLRASQSRQRSDSASTTTSVSITGGGTGSNTVGGGVSIAGQRPESLLQQSRSGVVSLMSSASSVAVGVPEEELKVGESAANTVMRTTGTQPWVQVQENFQKEEV